MKLLPWTKLPSGWIAGHGLREFRWVGSQGANDLAALMVLTAIANHSDEQTGVARLTYNALCDATTLSKAKLSAGLKVLEGRQLIERKPEGRGTYKLAKYDRTGGWAKFPARGLYKDDTITAFRAFRLRQAAELEAMKLYFLFAARRDDQFNWALITYDDIERYTGIPRNNIRRALSVLGATSLVYVEHLESRKNEGVTANAYRLVHLHPHIHMGTRGRQLVNTLADHTFDDLVQSR